MKNGKKEAKKIYFHLSLYADEATRAGLYGVRFPAPISDFFHYQIFKIFPGANPVSNSIGTVVLFPGVKRSLSEADHSTPSRTELKNEYCCTCNPPVRRG